MKGVVFTELFSFVETSRSPEFLQEAINASGVASRGVYTSAGAYPPEELGALARAMSDREGVPVSALMRRFGEHLFARFCEIHPQMLQGATNAFEFLGRIEGEIHADVRKLYPDAELPTLTVLEETPTMMRLVYKSSRNLEDFCEGLISGCLAHFGEAGQISRRALATRPASIVEFTIRRNA